MTHHLRIIALTALGAFASTAASAHAFLDHAIPGVGSTVSGSPSELELRFTQNVVVALSGVTLTSTAGAIAVAKPDGNGADLLRVRLDRALPPGTYTVSWHVVSVDTHPTSGSYKFTVAR